MLSPWHPSISNESLCFSNGILQFRDGNGNLLSCPVLSRPLLCLQFSVLVLSHRIQIFIYTCSYRAPSGILYSGNGNGNVLSTVQSILFSVTSPVACTTYLYKRYTYVYVHKLLSNSPMADLPPCPWPSMRVAPGCYPCDFQTTRINGQRHGGGLYSETNGIML